MNEEAKKFIELFRKLDFDSAKRLYYMIKGAAVVAEKEKPKVS